jgi:hypothetical protein
MRTKTSDTNVFRPGKKMVRNLCLLVFLVNIAHAAVFSVGSDAACTHNNLAAAIAAAEGTTDVSSTILLASNGSNVNVTQSLDANKILLLRGGYSNCSAAVSYNPALRVTVSAAGGTGSVFTVDLPGTAATANVTFDTLVIRDGNNFLGGGINIRAGSVRLLNSEVRGNTGSLGAGINVSLGSNKTNPGALRIENSTIVSNTGASLGGGIYCDNVAIKIRNSSIIENTANTGGGVYQTNLCSIEMVGGSDPLFLRNNQAMDEGGGAYLDNGAQLLNAQDGRMFIDGNRAAFGAALYVDGFGPSPQQTLVSLRNAWIRGNTSAGSAISLQGNARFALFGDPSFVRCEGNDYCTRISNNSGGALSLSGPGASVLLDKVAVQNNASTVATRGAVLALSGDIGAVQFNNTLITGNQGPLLVSMDIPASSPAPIISESTLVGNTITTAAFGRFGVGTGGRVNLSHSIVFHGVPVSASGGAAVAVAVPPGTCLPLVNENASVGGNSFGRVASSAGLDANFVPAATGVAADACSNTGQPTDVNQKPRSVDLPVGNLLGAQDQGAIERQSELFRDGFE